MSFSNGKSDQVLADIGPIFWAEKTYCIATQDKLGWNPIMTSTKADSGVEEMVNMFLAFLEPRMDAAQVGWAKDWTLGTISHLRLLERQT